MSDNLNAIVIVYMCNRYHCATYTQGDGVVSIEEETIIRHAFKEQNVASCLGKPEYVEFGVAQEN